MILSVSNQVKLFFLMIFSGLLIGFCYDLLRLSRKIIKHKDFFVQVEDFLFWIIVSCGTFLLILGENFGQIRFFCIGGIFFGLLFYWLVFSAFILKILFCVSDFFIKVCFRMIKIFCSPIKILLNIFKPFFRVIRKFFCGHYLFVKRYCYVCNKRSRLKLKRLINNLKIMFKKI